MNYRFPTSKLGIELLSSINSIAMFPLSNNSYQWVGEKPQWLDLLGYCCNKQKQLILERPQNFLENFLLDANKFWVDTLQGSLRSGKWVQTDSKGIDHPFEAIATKLKGEPVLLVQQIYESYSEIEQILQNAREDAISREKIEYLAYRDELTGLYNRRGFMLLAKEQMLIARRNKKPVTLACIDIDGLKTINDEYGHQTGDLAIVNAALLFKRFFRQKDILGRIGGDEFLILAINMSSSESKNFAVRLQQALGDWNTYKEPSQYLSFSIGLASDDAKEITLEEMFHEADAKMYTDKQNKYQNQLGDTEYQLSNDIMSCESCCQ